MKIQVEITSKTNKSIEGNERKKIKNERGITEQIKNELKGWSLGFLAKFYRRIHRRQ